jgi:hypothetical protein
MQTVGAVQATLVLEKPASTPYKKGGGPRPVSSNRCRLITPKFKSASATTDSAKNHQSYLKFCYSIFKIASPHPKVISDFLYEEELLNLRIQTPVCSDTSGNEFLTPAG